MRTRASARASSEQAERVPDAQPRCDPERLESDPPGELGDAAPAIDQVEGKLPHARAQPGEVEVQLDLDRITVRAHAVDPDPLEDLAAHAAEAARGVGDRETRDAPHV